MPHTKLITAAAAWGWCEAADSSPLPLYHCDPPHMGCLAVAVAGAGAGQESQGGTQRKLWPDIDRLLR